jgi:hypothetical protein
MMKSLNHKRISKALLDRIDIHIEIPLAYCQVIGSLLFLFARPDSNRYIRSELPESLFAFLNHAPLEVVDARLGRRLDSEGEGLGLTLSNTFTGTELNPVNPPVEVIRRVLAARHEFRISVPGCCTGVFHRNGAGAARGQGVRIQLFSQPVIRA